MRRTCSKGSQWEALCTSIIQASLPVSKEAHIKLIHRTGNPLYQIIKDTTARMGATRILSIIQETLLKILF